MSRVYTGIYRYVPVCTGIYQVVKIPDDVSQVRTGLSLCYTMQDRKDMREKNIGVHDWTQNLCGCENRQSSQSSRMHDLFNDDSSDGTEPDSEAQAPNWRVGSSALELRHPGENDSPGRTLSVPFRHGDEPKWRPTVTAGPAWNFRPALPKFKNFSLVLYAVFVYHPDRSSKLQAQTNVWSKAGSIQRWLDYTKPKIS